jgi:archaellin
MSWEKRVIATVMKPKNITGPEAMIILLALLITAAAFSFIVLNMGYLSD